MNIKMTPFDNVKVRQAVNMAINKDRIVQHHQQPRGAGQPAAAAVDARLRQGLQGLCLRRRQGQGAAGRGRPPDGFETELYAMNTDPNPRIAQAIQQDLAAIGIKAEIQSLAQANVIAAGGDKAGAPMIWSGGMALDRRLPGSVQLLRTDPRLRRRGRRAAGTGRGTATRISTPRRPRPTP